MKNIILLLMFLVSIFVINIIFYYNAPGYRDFLKRVKVEAERDISHEDATWSNNGRDSYFSGILEEKKVEEKNIIVPEDNKNNISNNNKEKQEIKQEVKLGKSYQDILNMFSEYDMKLLPISANLFDITNEYPDSYYEFYSKKLTLYFFTTKSYKEIYDIFDVLQLGNRFSINSTDNFGEKSFYINLEEDINDGIRVVISNNGIVFGLKIDKDEYYNSIKQKLQNLRNN